MRVKEALKPFRVLEEGVSDVRLRFSCASGSFMSGIRVPLALLEEARQLRATLEERPGDDGWDLHRAQDEWRRELRKLLLSGGSAEDEADADT